MNSMSRRYAVPAALSLGFFAFLLLGFPKSGAPAKLPTKVIELVPIDRIVMPADDPDIVAENSPAPAQPVVPISLPDAISSTPITVDSFVIPLAPHIPPTEGASPIVIPSTIVGAPQTGPGGFGPVRISRGDLDNNPRATFQPAPVYPFEMKRGNIEGTVDIAFIVDTNGSVINAYVVRSDNAGFEEPALQAVRRWRFEPGIKTGRKVRYRMAQTLVFKLDR
jgi:protein TonB